MQALLSRRRPKGGLGNAYRQSHDVKGSTGGAQSNYSVRIRAFKGLVGADLYVTTPTAACHEGTAYAVIGNSLYWGVNFGGCPANLGHKYKTNLLTGVTTELLQKYLMAEWMGVKVGTKVYSVGESGTGVGLTQNASIHIIDSSDDSVTEVLHPNTRDCNELIGVGTDGTYLVAGERHAGGTDAGSNWPNGGGVWRIPMATITDPNTWTRTYEDPTHWLWQSIAYFNGKWYAALYDPGGTGWKVISSSDLVNWTTELSRAAGSAFLQNCGSKLACIGRHAGAARLFVLDGGVWSEYDISATGLEGAMIWVSEKSKLMIFSYVAPNHRVYSINIDGTGLETVITTVPKCPSSSSAGQGEYTYYHGDVFYGLQIIGAGDGAIGRVYAHSAYSNVLLNGRCRSDFGDMRFTRSDGLTKLDYWVESYVNGEYAFIWIEVDSIPADPNKATIYAYYGKPDATSESNGDNTFSLFDNFDDNVINPAKWTTGVQNGAAIAEVNQRIQESGTATAQFWICVAYLQSILTFPSNFAVHVIKLSAGGSGTGYAMFITFRTAATEHMYYIDREGASITRRKNILGVDTQIEVITAATFSGQFNWKCLIGAAQIKWYEDDVLKSTDNISWAGGANVRLRGAARAIGDTFTAYWDTIFVRNYVDPEPTHDVWGTEEPVIWPW